MEHVISYTFTAEWVAGKLNKIADALSRSPVEIDAHERRHDILTWQFLS